MKTLENILTEGFAEMEVGLREVELGIAYSKTKEALTLVKNSLAELRTAKERYNEVTKMSIEEANLAWIERRKLS